LSVEYLLAKVPLLFTGVLAGQFFSGTFYQRKEGKGKKEKAVEESAPQAGLLGDGGRRLSA
jgi:hypothetical protein